MAAACARVQTLSVPKVVSVRPVTMPVLAA